MRKTPTMLQKRTASPLLGFTQIPLFISPPQIQSLSPTWCKRRQSFIKIRVVITEKKLWAPYLKDSYLRQHHSHRLSSLHKLIKQVKRNPQYSSIMAPQYHMRPPSIKWEDVKKRNAWWQIKFTPGKRVSPPSTPSVRYISIVATRCPPLFKLNCRDHKQWNETTRKAIANF